MILYLEFIAQQRRGGEMDHVNLHQFLTRHFESVIPAKLARLPEGVRSPRQQMTYCRDLVRKHKPDLLVSCVPSATRNILGLRYAKSIGCKLLTLISAKPDPYPTRSAPQRWLAGRCESYLFRHTDFFVANSNYTASIAQERSGRDVPIVVANCGLEYEPEAFLPRVPKDDGPLTILFVGELSRVKGLAVLLDALTRVGDLDWRLIVAGGGTQEPDYRARIESFVTRHQIADRVDFRGFVDRPELLALYAECDLLVIPSNAEGYCKVMAEAIGAGIPTVATRVGAIEELSENGRHAVLVDPGDPDQLAAGLVKLASDHELRERLSRSSRAHAPNLPTWEEFHATLDRELLPLLQTFLPR